MNAPTAAFAPEHDSTHPDTTAMATQTTLLNPRFYTTDFDEMDAIDVTPVPHNGCRLPKRKRP